MSLTLDPALEARIQREVDLGHFPDADAVINAALDLLPSPEQEEWLQRNREALNEHLEESYAQAERGELYTPEEARALLAQDRQDRQGRQDRAKRAALELISSHSRRIG